MMSIPHLLKFLESRQEGGVWAGVSYGYKSVTMWRTNKYSVDWRSPYTGLNTRLENKMIGHIKRCVITSPLRFF